MAKRAMIRKMVKWGGLVACVLLAVAWVGSCWYEAWWVTPGDGALGVHGGQFVLIEPPWPLGLGGSGWLKTDQRVKKMDWGFGWGQDRIGRFVAVPLWIPLLIMVGATAAAWWADVRARRRQRVGACPACAYDRRGLDAGKVCPECGAPSRGESMAKPGG